jgi:chemotaxis protein methyltransferase CheR
MHSNAPIIPANIRMSDKEFKRFSEFIHKRFGINLPPVKKTMLTSRLLKRLRSLNIQRFSDYYDYLMSSKGQKNEVIHMIDVVSTNKTEFFRESGHFDFLKNVALPGIVSEKKKWSMKKVNVWSAGCSSGEEAYTLALVIAEFLESYPGITFSIFASDISQQMLIAAERAIYSHEAVKNIPLRYVHKYFMRGARSQTGFYRIAPKLRNCVRVKYFNLMESFSSIPTKMDFIFCRNVMIYFNRDTRESLVNNFYHQLKDGGYLFIGNSETLNGLDTNFRQAGPTIYRKADNL